MLSKLKEWWDSTYYVEALDQEVEIEGKRAYSPQEITELVNDWKKKTERAKIARDELNASRELLYGMILSCYDFQTGLGVVDDRSNRDYTIIDLQGDMYKVIYGHYDYKYGPESEVFIESIKPIKLPVCEENCGES